MDNWLCLTRHIFSPLSVFSHYEKRTRVCPHCRGDMSSVSCGHSLPSRNVATFITASRVTDLSLRDFANSCGVFIFIVWQLTDELHFSRPSLLLSTNFQSTIRGQCLFIYLFLFRPNVYLFFCVLTSFLCSVF